MHIISRPHLSLLSSRAFAVLAALALVACGPAAGPVSDSEDNTGDGSTGNDFNGGNEEEPPDGLVLNPDLLILDEDPCIESVSFEEDREEIEFSFGCEPSVHELAVGKIIVGSENGGYLRRVLELIVDGTTVTAITEAASLNEVIEHGSMSEDIILNTGRALIDFSNTVLYSGNHLGSDVLVYLNRGAFDIAPALELDGHWSYGSMERFEMDLGVDFTADLRASISSTNRLRWGKEVELWQTSWPFAFAIGPLPVAGLVTVALKTGFRIDAPGQVSTTIGANGEMEIHTAKSWTEETGWINNDVFEGNWDIIEPELDISNRVKSRIYGRLDSELKLYGVAGPRVFTDLFVQAIGEAGCAGLDYTINAGVEARCTVKLNIMDKFKPEKTFVRATLTADLAEGHIPWPLSSPVLCEHQSIACGQTVTGSTADSERAMIDGYQCLNADGFNNTGNYEAAEVIYQWKANRSGPVEWTLQDATPTETNHDLFVFDGYTELASNSCSIWNHGSVEFDAVEGRTYFLVVDGYDQDEGPYTAQLLCDGEANAGSTNSEDTINPW